MASSLRPFFVKLSISLCLFAGAKPALAADLTGAFQDRYEQAGALSAGEQALLKGFDIYLVPGILSETFLYSDGRSKVSFAALTGNYFEAEKTVLLERYGFSVKRLSSSSKSVYEIRFNIRQAIQASRQAQRKAIFMTHSLGGLALLNELVTVPQEQDSIAGIIFLQSPFYGTPVADLYFSNPYAFSTLLQPILPFVNTSEETLRYLGTQERGSFMKDQNQAVLQFVQKIPLVTVAGVANDFASLFKPAVNIMAEGCLSTVLSHCVGPSLYSGPFDLSDGMVPLKSSKLPGADYVVLQGADHGETVVDIPFTNYDKARMTEALLSLLVAKIIDQQ